MPTIAALMVMCDQLEYYRLHVGGDGNATGEERRLEPLEVGPNTSPALPNTSKLQKISLLYHRFRPVVSCGILVRLLAALVLLMCPARDVARFFLSPIVNTVFTCKYTDGALDASHKQLDLFRHSCKDKRWNPVVKPRFRDALFKPPHVRRNIRADGRAVAFEVGGPILFIRARDTVSKLESTCKSIKIGKGGC